MDFGKGSAAKVDLEKREMKYIIKIVSPLDPNQPMYLERVSEDGDKILTDQPDYAIFFPDAFSATLAAEIHFSGCNFPCYIVPREQSPTAKTWLLQRNSLRKLT